MNFNIYLNDDLARRLDDYVKAKNISRSRAISEALSIWLEVDNKNWQYNFFDFDPDPNFPDIVELRSNLKDNSSDPLS